MVATLPAGLTWRGAPMAVTDNYPNSLLAGQTLTVSDPSKGVIANDINVYGVKVQHSRRARHADAERERHLYIRSRHTWTYCAQTRSIYQANGMRSHRHGDTRCRRRSKAGSGITCHPGITFTSNVGHLHLSIKSPGILVG